jgi:hypothetical protein
MEDLKRAPCKEKTPPKMAGLKGADIKQDELGRRGVVLRAGQSLQPIRKLVVLYRLIPTQPPSMSTWGSLGRGTGCTLVETQDLINNK